MRSLFLGVVFVGGTVVLASAASACGGSSDSPAQPPPTTMPPPVEEVAPDAAVPDSAPPVDNGAPSTSYPAPHPPLPELVNPAHGKILATPKAYLIVYPGYTYQTQVTSLAQTIGATPYWAAATSEYGIGALGYAGVVELTGETAPTTITDTAIESLIADKLASGAFGEPDPNAIYTIFFPKTTTITMKGGPFGTSQSCSTFGGYHGNINVAAGSATKRNFAFAVLPTCAAFGGMGELDSLTGALSHEWAEAVTDPFPSTNQGNDSAYSSVDQDHFIWIVLGGAENGDLCAQEKDAFFKPQGMDFTVQRTWSNKLAKASHNPCAPNLPSPPAYFNSAPVLDEDVTLDLSVLGGGSTETKGVKIPVGKSKTIEVDLFSDAATSGPWTVDAQDTIAALTRSQPTLDFKWDRNKGVNGEKLHLTVTVKSEASIGQGAHPFSITSTLGGTKRTWPALVVDQ